MKIKVGDFNQYGAIIRGDEVTFTFAVKATALKVAIVIYSIITKEIVQIFELSDEYRLGLLYSATISGIDAKKHCYRFAEDDITYVDPYAYAVTGRDKYNDISREKASFEVYGAFTDILSDWQDSKVKIEPKDMIMYKLHMRGFTMNNGMGSGAGNYKGVIKNLSYLRSLGVTSLEIMPLYDFEEMVIVTETEYSPSGKKETIKTTGKVNYWGYGEAYHLAPKSSYFKGNPTGGLRELVSAIHSAGMEVIMEMSFPVTVTDDYIINTLKYYVKFFHVDGFHVIGCNFPTKRFAENAYFGDTKLFVETITDSIIEISKGNKHIFVYDNGFMCVVRQMINHMNGSMVQFANHMRRQNKDFGFVNYPANVDGFTLWDCFSYGEKHNEDNGEENRDGNNFNYSNNYGVEGKTNNKSINAIRMRNMRMALASTILSQGIPLINSGDEFANSNIGNNNPYCQDNKIGWVNFTKAKDRLLLTRFLTQLIEFRKQHSCIHPERAMAMNDFNHVGIPDMSYHGSEPWMMSIGDETRALGILFAGQYADEDEEVYLCFNHHYNEVSMALPRLSKGKRWRLVTNTYDYDEKSNFEPTVIDNQQSIVIPGGSMSILVGQMVK